MSHRDEQRQPRHNRGDAEEEEGGAHPPSSSSAFSVSVSSSSSQRSVRRRRQRRSAASGRPPPPRSSARVLLIMGPMWAGKSEELLRLHRRSCVAGKRCLLIKHAKDTRYGEEGQDVLITHAGRSQAVTLAATTLAEAESRALAAAAARHQQQQQQQSEEGGGGVDRAAADPPAPTSLADLFDHVFVDEGQFFEGLRDTVLRWCGEGMDVDVSALDAFADQALWPEIAGLLPFAVKECLTAVCMRCGADNATLTVRRDPEAFRRDRRDPHAIDVGGIKTFEVVCARCWIAAAEEAKEGEGGDNS